MDIKLITTKRALYLIILLVALLIIPSTIIMTASHVSAVFDSEAIEEAKRDFPDATPSPSQIPNASPSTSSTPQASATPEPADNINSAENSNQTDNQKIASDTTPWLVAGVALLIVLLASGIWFTKKRK